MITYQVESLTDCIDEMLPLWSDHYYEVDSDRGAIPMEPDYARYLEIDEMGMLSTVTIRDDNTLAGYCIDFITPSLHQSSNIISVNDLLYIIPNCRRQGCGKKLLQTVHEHLVKRKVAVHYLAMKVDYPFEAMAEALGYSKVEYNYRKILGE